jgi:succinylglutamate desuccinylase
MNLNDLIDSSSAQYGDFLQFTLDHPESASAANWHLANGTSVELWDTGVIVFNPSEPSTLDLILSSGVHGNETAPIELCAAICQDLLQEKLLAKARVMFLFGNPPAINAGKRELVDNLNRLFSGHHAKGSEPYSWERQRAAKLEEYVTRFFKEGGKENKRALYDLHTAIRGSQFEKFAVYPFLHGQPWSETQFEFLAACDVHTVLLMQTPASTFSYYASQAHGAAAFTIELGKVRPFGENDMTRFTACDDSLRKLIAGLPIATAAFKATNFNLFAVNRAINKTCEAFSLSFAANIENFTQLPVGSLLAVDGDTEYRVEEGGEAIIFPNANVALGQRAMLLVKPFDVTGFTSRD